MYFYLLEFFKFYISNIIYFTSTINALKYKTTFLKIGFNQKNFNTYFFSFQNILFIHFF